MFDDIKSSSLNSLFPSNYYHFNNCNFNYHEVHFHNSNNNNNDEKDEDKKKRINFHEIIREHIVPLIHKQKKKDNDKIDIIIHIGTIFFNCLEDRYTKLSTFEKYWKKEGSGYKKIERQEIKGFNGSIFKTSDIHDFEIHYEEINKKYFFKKKGNVLETYYQKENKIEKKIYQFNSNTYYVVPKNNENDKKDSDIRKKANFFSTVHVQETLYFHWLDENMSSGLDLRIAIVKINFIKDKNKIRNYIANRQDNSLFRKYKEVEVNLHHNQKTNVPYFCYKVKLNEKKEQQMNEIFLKSVFPSYNQENTNRQQEKNLHIVYQLGIPEWIKYFNDLFDFILLLKKRSTRKRKIMS